MTQEEAIDKCKKIIDWPGTGCMTAWSCSNCPVAAVKYSCKELAMEVLY